MKTKGALVSGAQRAVVCRRDRDRRSPARRGDRSTGDGQAVPLRPPPADGRLPRSRAIPSWAAMRAPASSPRSARASRTWPSAITWSCRSSRPAENAFRVRPGCRISRPRHGPRCRAQSVSDGSFRVTAGGKNVLPMSLLGTFAPYVVVHETSVVKVDPDIPFDVACLVGCGVTTGYGSAVRSAAISPATTWRSSVSAASGSPRCRAPDSPGPDGCSRSTLRMEARAGAQFRRHGGFRQRRRGSASPKPPAA